MVNRTRRHHGGRRNNSRKSRRGIFSTVYSPVHNILGTGRNVLKSGLNTVVNVPTYFVKGAKNTVSGSVGRLLNGADNIGGKIFSGVNRTLGHAFSRKGSRKNRRMAGGKRSRKGSRKSRKGSRKGSRKSRKGSRKNRKASRKNRKASRKNRRNENANMYGGKRRKSRNNRKH